VAKPDRLERANVQNITRTVEGAREGKSVVRKGHDYAIEIERVFEGKFLGGARLYAVGKQATG
jgi:hypothetical protein